MGKLSFAEKQLFWYTNMLRYARKHFSRAEVLILRMGIIKGMLLRSLAALLGSGPKQADTHAALSAYWNVIKLAFGRSSQQRS